MSPADLYQSLQFHHFDNAFVNTLPADTNPDNHRRQVPGACYSRVAPTRVSAPEYIAHSREVAEMLDLSESACISPEFTEVFVGNKLLSGMDPFAMCYGGHQFGNWAGQLGDGRAINLVEVINRQGQRLVLQLKGAGPTPYSRSADGLAVLRSSVREFLCSEAMFHLGVPTTRALSLITTGEMVERDMFYDGHPADEKGAVVCRVSPSFIRFGNFEIFAARKENEILQQLVDYTIATDFPHLGPPSTNTYLEWYSEVCQKTAEMIVHWMRVGFVHGVMNTDNMSILGLTIDYGPYGWLEDYDPNWTPNTTDAQGKRYAFGNQPHVALWNLAQLANAIYPLIGDTEPLQEALDKQYRQQFLSQWRTMMANKIGMRHYSGEDDDELFQSLFELFDSAEMDMTIFFRQLAELGPDLPDESLNEVPPPLAKSYYQTDEINEEHLSRLHDWLQTRNKRLQIDGADPADRKALMNSTNPKYVLRNYLAQMAIDKAEEDDFSLIDDLLELLRHPYDEQPDQEKYYAKRPEWAKDRPGCAMLS